MTPDAIDIAIVGIGLRLPPDITDLATFWQALLDQRELQGVVRESVDGQRIRVPAGDGSPAGLLDCIDEFDPAPFGISADEARAMDPQQRLVLESTWECLADASLSWTRLQGSRTGVFVGAYAHDWLMVQTGAGAGQDAFAGAGSSLALLANRVSYLLDLHGPSVSVDTACSSSLTALHLALQALRLGECDRAIVSGVALGFDPAFRDLTKGSLPFSPTNRCRPFDSEADGITRGEGVVTLLLEPTRKVAPDRRTHGRIVGSAVNHGGRTNGISAPSSSAQAALLAETLGRSGLVPDDVAYIEAHGTGTNLGDPIEAKAIAASYGERTRSCFVGSVKAALGHLEAAAGLAGLLTAMLVANHGLVPGQRGFTRLNPAIPFDGARLRVAAETVPLADGPRHTAVSSFGFGGSNAHVVLAPGRPAPQPPAPASGLPVLLLSAATERALDDLRTKLRDRLTSADDAQTMALGSHLGRTSASLPHRLAWSAAEPAGLRRAVLNEAGGSTEAKAPGRAVLVFSGQGSAWPGMGADLLTQPEIAPSLDRWDREIRDIVGWSVRDAFATAEVDGTTERAQVCIAVVQIAWAEMLHRWGVLPVAVIGHSMGEVSAAVAAGTLASRDGFRVLATRAAAMEGKARGGAMLGVDITEHEAGALLDSSPQLAIAAVNSPRSVVLAGDRGELTRLAERFRLGAVSHRWLPVDYAFHSPLLNGVEPVVAQALADVQQTPPKVRIYSTVTGTRLRVPMDGPYWGANVRDTVRLADATVAALRETGAGTLIEVGPHPVLQRDLWQLATSAGRSVSVLATLSRGAAWRPSAAALAADLHREGLDLDAANFVAPDSGTAALHYSWDRRRLWPAAGESVPASVSPRAAVDSTGREPNAPDTQALTRFICVGVAEAIDLTTADAVPEDVPLRDWEIESLAVVNLRNRAERTFGIQVPLPVLLSGASPRMLAHRLIHGSESAEDLLGRLDHFSDAEVAHLLRELQLETGGQP